ncbi:response regulator [Telmatospirillum sp.]|uniref:response regulator n=1 Tax=Telmatospirillum sp. TaxID=2079197 RepID=UPI00283FAF24|nr:response regulator [Telmatospirillum sp.]MDR3441367.1 response regulator [Telmatospirillum sp.]
MISGSDRSGDRADRSGKTILIVEDDDLNMKLLHDLLEMRGYRTLQSRSGREAIDTVRSQYPDLILMDIQLPDMSGLEVTRIVKEDPKLRHIPVVAVTAYALSTDEERIRAGGCDGYLSKPISIDGFLWTVAGFVGTPAGCDAL